MDTLKTPKPDPQPEGGVKTGQPVAPTPQNQTAPGEVRTEERSADPSLSIESVNGESGSRRAGGMIGEGGH